jgi:hypothetical protein
MTKSELDADLLFALIREKPIISARRYTLDVIDGQVVFRLPGIDAVFEKTLADLFPEAPQEGDYNTVIVTDAGPIRLDDAPTDRTQSSTSDFQRNFFGRS